MLSISNVTPSELDHAYNLIGGVVSNVISKAQILAWLHVYLQMLIIRDVAQRASTDRLLGRELVQLLLRHSHNKTRRDGISRKSPGVTRQ